MKNLYVIFCAVCFLFISNNVFAASFTGGSYAAPTPASQFSNSNNQRLRSQVSDYSSTMQKELDKLHNSNSTYSFLNDDEDEVWIDGSKDKKKKTKQKMNQNVLPNNSDNSLDIQQERWWRENSRFERWKMD